MRTGILGGTFNPIHLAHLRIAEEVRETCGLDRVLFIPAADPPHKTVAEEVPFAHRMAMVEAAIADNPYFTASDIEKRRQGKSFSVDTLKILRQEDPDGELFFIIGLDSYRDLTSWKEYARLFELAHVVVTTRPGIELQDPLTPLPVAVQGEFCYASGTGMIRHKSGNSLIFLTETRLDISSTEIRYKVADGASIRYLVTPAVAAYITQHDLYSRSIQGSL
jgi:nicotinate-nucleotide adenylyltransferase